jgi:capsular polysaccharide biosynthesis protein
MSSEERLRFALRRFAPLILLCTVLGAAALVGIGELEGAQYRASSQVIVVDPDLDAALTEPGAATNAEPQTLGATAALLAASPGFFQSVAGELHEPDWKALQSNVEVSQSGNSALLSFTTTAPTAARAVALASELAHAFPLYRASVELAPIQQALAAARREAARAPGNQQLKTSIAHLALLQTVTTGGLQIGAAAAATKIRPALARSLLEGATVGFVVGLLLMAGLEAFDTKVRSRTEIERTLGLRTLGIAPASPHAAGSTNGHDRQAQRLVVALDDFRALGQGTVVAMVGATEESGLLGTTAFLAESLRARDERVCVIDGGASLYERDLSTNGATAPIAVAPPGADVGAAAPLAAAPLSADQSLTVEVLHASDATADLRPWLAPVMDDLRLRFDWILIDSSPALSSARASRLAGAADAVVLVAHLGKITRSELERVGAEIAGWPREPVGTILLGARVD